jgi:hypothetical protein
MAITNNGTQNSLKPLQLPTGYTPPTITTFTDWEYKNTLVLSILKETVDEATSVATMDAIFDNATIGLDKQVEDIVAADFLASATVTTYADLVILTTNVADVSSGDGTWLKSTAESYIATVVLYVKTLTPA